MHNSEKINPLIGMTPPNLKIREDYTQDRPPFRQEVNLPEANDRSLISLTSSGLLSKHLDNIARLAGSLGVQLDQKDKPTKLEKLEEVSGIQFDREKFS